MTSGRALPWLAAAAALLCAAAAALGFLLPWMATDPSGGREEAGRADLAGSAVSYERHFVQWPAVALPAAAAALGAAAWLERAPRADPRLRRAAWLLAGAAAIPAAVAGARLFGFQNARLLDDGPALVRLLVPPYATLLAAVAALALAAWRLSAEPRPAHPPGGSLACAATLLFAPLLPFAVTAGGFAYHLDEMTLAVAAEADPDALAGAPADLGRARVLLWAGAAAGAAAALAADWLPAAARWRPWALAAAALPAAGAAFFAVRFHWRLAQADGVDPGWNYLVPAGALAALGLQAWAAARSFRPAPAPAAAPLPRKT